MPAQLRQLLSTRPTDVQAGFVRLLPAPARPFRIQRWTVRRIGLWSGLLLALLALAAATAGSVNNDLAVRTPINVHRLGCTGLQSLWLEAQSVPSASLVPCVRALPAGWTLGSVTVVSGRSDITFDHDRAGVGAVAVRLAAACDTAGATPVPSDQQGIRRYQRIDQVSPVFRATRFDVFAGGCVSTQIRPLGGTRYQAQLVNEARTALGYTTRRALQEALEARSGGRLHLDPVG